jgi:lipopolysaccharide/colanic/teichoic acid biosynthesis glycosyltransferase/glycosyltransferase involved in cell wall biosynthesis
MKILLITNLFHPEPNFLKGLAFAKELQRRGHDVHVLTGFPNYPGGKIYPGHTVRWTVREQLEGIAVTRVAMYASHDGSAVRRIASYLSVGLSLALHSLSRERFDVCHVYLGPITLMWAAVLRRWLGGARIVADVQDIWPESVTDSGMLRSSTASGVLDRWCRWAYCAADRLLVLSPGYARALVERGVDPPRIDVIYNWCDEGALVSAGAPAEGILDARAFNIVYAGNMGKLQALDTVLDAAKSLAATARQVRFVLIGDGVEAVRLRRRVEDEQIANVRFHGRLALERVNAVQRAADLLLVHLEPSTLTRMAIPSKVQSCLACGTPVLIAMEGDAADLVERSGGGVICPPRDPARMAAAINAIAEMPPDRRAAMGENARRYYETELSFRKGVDAIERVLVKVTAEASPPAPRLRRSSIAGRVAKRVMDVVASALGVIALAPIFAAVGIAIRTTMGAPVLFTQERPGLRGRLFRVVKFRTMRTEVDATGRALSDERRLTRLGAFLRATSLDELPQLWNVLIGDVSLVGPRPLLPQYLPRYTPEQARRHDVKPGITGWAQVNGRNAISWEQRFALDVWYVDHWSLWLDLKILALTALRVVKRDGIAQQGHVTMPEFMGTDVSPERARE